MRKKAFLRNYGYYFAVVLIENGTILYEGSDIEKANEVLNNWNNL